MKFNHYTINTHHNYIQDTNEILKDKEYKDYFYKLFRHIKDNPETPIYLVDNIYVKGVVEQDAYMITLQTGNGLPLLETAGAFDEISANHTEEIMGDFYKKIFHTNPNIEKKSVPIVWDVILPLAVMRVDMLEWTGDFCRSFGAIAFEEMKKEKRNDKKCLGAL